MSDLIESWLQGVSGRISIFTYHFIFYLPSTSASSASNHWYIVILSNNSLAPGTSLSSFSVVLSLRYRLIVPLHVFRFGLAISVNDNSVEIHINRKHLKIKHSMNQGRFELAMSTYHGEVGTVNRV